MNREGASFFYRYKLHHALLWIVYYLFWVYVYRNAYDTNTLFAVTAIYAVFHAIAFYSIVYYLFPRYLNNSRYLHFFSYLTVVLLITSLGLAGCLYYIFIKLTLPFELKFADVFIIALSATVTIVGVLSAAKLIIEKIREDRMKRLQEKQRLESELQYLKAQVNPHFLFNAINSVYFLIKKDADKAAETLIKLSDLLRFQLYDCTEDRIPIEKELEYIENYISLEQIRKGEKVTIRYTKQGELSGFDIAPFMLIPFLENAFKFVSQNNEGKTEIMIDIMRERNIFKAIFYNTQDNQPVNSVGGIGLKNVTRRLELLYPNQYTLDISNDKESYTVTLIITKL